MKHVFASVNEGEPPTVIEITENPMKPDVADIKPEYLDALIAAIVKKIKDKDLLK